VHSAKIFEKSGFKAIGTSSGALANTLGYEDGEQIPFSDLFFIVERIMKNIQIPVSVDMEAGYGKSLPEIAQNLKRLIEIGVVGINLEDSIPQTGKLQNMESYCEKLQFIKSELAKEQLNIFINARTDAFLLGMGSPLEETLPRIKAYQEAGADSIFVPLVCQESDIQQVVAATHLPINVLAMPNLPKFDKLTDLGVKRISMGTAIYRSLQQKLNATIQQINQEKSFDSLFVKN
jgi:2-methylisocitrate lyase-like PEP mutase family enzyme